MKLFKKNFIYIVLLCIFILPLNAFSKAEDAEITNLLLSRNKNNAFVSFSVKNAFSEDVLKIIQSGIPVIFSFDIKIIKKRSFFPDKTVYDNEIIHKLKYSSLTKTYFIKKPYISEEPYIIHSPERAKSEMITITSLPLDNLQFEQNSEYRIKARARLREITLPFYLHKIFFFLSMWDFKTGWHSMDIEF